MAEDNPVASLDELYEKWRVEENDGFKSHDVMYFLTYLKKQNAVETNKVQPEECNHNYRTETGWSVCSKCGDMF